MVCQFTNHAEVRFLPVYYPSPEERASPDLYAAHCQKMIAHVVQLPISDAQFKDYKAFEKAYSKRKHDEERFTFIDAASPAVSPAAKSLLPLSVGGGGGGGARDGDGEIHAGATPVAAAAAASSGVTSPPPLKLTPRLGAAVAGTVVEPLHDKQE